MAKLDYARASARQNARESYFAHQADDFALRHIDDKPKTRREITKAQARAQADAALAVYQGTIKRHLKCFNCFHEGTIEVRCEKDVPLPMRAVCSRCGRKIHLGGWDP